MTWEQDGFAIWYKQLQSGTFAVPDHQGDSLALTSQQLALLLTGVDLRQTRPRKRYRREVGARKAG